MNNFSNEAKVGNQAGTQNFHGAVHFVTNANGLQDDADGVTKGSLNKVDHAILRSLSFPEMLERRSNVEQPHPGSCAWILDLTEYIQWRNKPRGMLWIKGKPGSGKSTMMAFLYEELKKQRHTDRGIYLDFFFSARGSELQRTPLGMLRSLLNQLYLRDPTIRPLVKELYEEKCSAFGYADNMWQWRRPELEKLFHQAVILSAQQKPVNIFVDALDEAGDVSAREIAAFFHIVNDRVLSTSPAKICMSCRHYPIPSQALSAEIHMEDHNGGDIEAFVRDHLRLEDFDDVDETDQAIWREVQDQLILKARGVFQWIRLVTPMVVKLKLDQEASAEVRQQVQRVPEGLTDVYEYIFRNVIEKHNYARSLQLFQWVCLAEERLTITKMRFALLAEEDLIRSYPVSDWGQADFLKKNEVMRTRVKAWSGGLLEETKEREETSFYRAESVIQVIHQSVKEYLLSHGLAVMNSLARGDLNSPFEDAGIDGERLIAMSQARLYKSCLSFLSLKSVIADTEVMRLNVLQGSSGAKKEFLKKYPLIDYAAINLFVHAKEASDFRYENMVEEITLLCQVIPAWVVLFRVYGGYNFSKPGEGATLLHAASATGLMAMIESLLGERAIVRETDKSGNTPLHYAARAGRLPTVNLLLQHGADPNAVNLDGETPFTQAAKLGHLNIIKTLLDKVSNNGQADTGFANALKSAARSGQTLIVKLLIETIEGQVSFDTVYNDALWSASAAGHAAVVKLLLEAGADVNSQSENGDSALHAACSFRWHYSDRADDAERTVKVLLLAGANIDVRASRYETCLHAALQADNEAVATLLLKESAFSGVHVEDLDDLLCLAARYGHLGILETLLQIRKSIDGWQRGVNMALHCVVRRWRCQAVKILVAAGADVNYEGEDDFGETPLHMAFIHTIDEQKVASERREIIKFLLDAGATVDSSNTHTLNAIQMACYKAPHDLDEIIQLLLDAGAAPNARKGLEPTALYMLCRKLMWPMPCKTRTIQKFLAAGANINIQVGRSGATVWQAAIGATHLYLLVSPLWPALRQLIQAGPVINEPGSLYAAMLGDAPSDDEIEERVQLLSRLSIDVHAQGGRYGNALQAASYRGSERIVKSLLELGVDANAKGGRYGTALQAASVAGSQTVVKLLLDAGADVDGFGGVYGTPLWAAVTAGRIHIVRTLIQAGANVNFPKWRTDSILLPAILGPPGDMFPHGVRWTEGHELDRIRFYDGNMADFVQHDEMTTEIRETITGILLDAGADSGQSPVRILCAAASQGMKRIVARLVSEYSSLQTTDQLRDGLNQALHAALLAGHVEVTRMLMKSGAVVNLWHGHYGSHLEATCSGEFSGNKAIVELLLQAGAQVDLKGGQFHTALQGACHMRRMSIIRRLIEAGADVNLCGGAFGTALQAAAAAYMTSSVRSEMMFPNDTSLAHLLIESGADVNIQGGFFGTALHAAACSHNLALVRILLCVGARVDTLGGLFGSPLQAAICGYPSYGEDTRRGGRLSGKSTVIDALVEAGADVNASGGIFGNALQAASFLRLEHIVQQMLDLGADVNAPGGLYGNALQAACHEEQSLDDLIAKHKLIGGVDLRCVELSLDPLNGRGRRMVIVQKLLLAGADINAQGGEYGCALQAACHNPLRDNADDLQYRGHSQEALVKLLLESGADATIQGGIYGTALQAASGPVYSSEAVMKLLIAAGADPHVQGGKYGSALQAASHGIHWRRIQILLEAGADPNQHLAGSHPALVLACGMRKGSEQAVRLLLDAGAEVDAVSEIHGTALCQAAARLDETIVRLLLQAGANPNLGAGRFPNALAAALQSESSFEHVVSGYDYHEPWRDDFRSMGKIVQMLIDAGADPCAADNMYGGALQQVFSLIFDDWAVSPIYRQASIDSMRRIRAHAFHWYADRSSPLQMALSALSLDQGDEKLVQDLVKAGADVNAPTWTYHGRPLHVAINQQDRRVIRILLKAGADPSLSNEAGQTSLHLAAKNGMLDVVHQLQDLNIDCNFRDLFDRTSLHLAIYYGQIKTVESLLSSGANPYQRDGYGRTALDWAVRNKDVAEIVATHINPIPPENEDVTRSVLHNSVHRLSQNLLKAGPKPLVPGFYGLGRCLVLLQDLDYARLSFGQQNRSRIECWRCDAYRNNRTNTKIRFICTVCPELNLCSSCMDDYTTRRPPVPGCRNHEFVRVDPFEDEEQTTGEGSSVSDETRKWLGELVEKYKDADTVLKETVQNTTLSQLPSRQKIQSTKITETRKGGKEGEKSLKVARSEKRLTVPRLQRPSRIPRWSPKRTSGGT